jgi:hypothetical protein
VLNVRGSRISSNPGTLSPDSVIGTSLDIANEVAEIGAMSVDVAEAKIIKRQRSHGAPGPDALPAKMRN